MSYSWFPALQSKTAFTIYSDDAENQPPPGAAKTTDAAKSSGAFVKPAPAPKQQQPQQQQRAFKIHEDKENAASSKAEAPSTETAAVAKGLSSRAQDAVLSSFNVQQKARNIPRVFQLSENAVQDVEKVSRVKWKTLLIVV